jgi:myo-inositol 2-dehydrogenase / D-chiro-inositol 1-dehydrogenase
MTAKLLKIGIAGLGRMGKSHARNIAWHTRHCALVSACSPLQGELDWAQGELGVTSLYADFEAFVRDPQIDAVVLVTPTTLHADQVIAALQAGKHVFCEKPLALNLADGERVQEVAQQHPKQVLMIGFVRRFDPSYVSAKAHIDAGRVGRPFLVRSQTCDKLDPSGFFVRFAPTSGGLFMDCSVHDIDVARWMLGNPKALRAFASGSIAVHEDLAAVPDIDNGLAIIEFEGGARAVIYASRTFAMGMESSSEIIGTAGKLLVGAGAARDRVEIGDAHGVRKLALDDFLERFAEAFRIEMQSFVDACVVGGALPMTLDDAVQATRIGLALTRSLRSGMPEAV